MKGSDAVAQHLGFLAPKRAAKGFVARFKALSGTGRGGGYLSRAGVSGTDRTRRGWTSGKAASKANRDAVDRAYTAWQRDNLVAKASKGGRRLTITADPAIRQRASSKGKPIPGEVTITVPTGGWDAMVDAYEKGDTAAMDKMWRAWIDASIMDSPPGRAYYQVSHVTFGGKR